MGLSIDPTYPFLGLLVVYMVYSQWARLDSRYLVAGALGLLVITAVVDAAGEVGAANVLATYVFYLLAAGVLLLLVDHIREERATAASGDPAAAGAASPSGAEQGPGAGDGAGETTGSERAARSGDAPGSSA